MGMLNRSAVVIRPLPPYLNWARHDDTTDIAERVFEDLRTAPHVYLLPEFKDAESAREAGRLLAGAVRGDVELLANRRAAVAEGPYARDVSRVVSTSRCVR